MSKMQLSTRSLYYIDTFPGQHKHVDIVTQDKQTNQKGVLKDFLATQSGLTSYWPHPSLKTTYMMMLGKLRWFSIKLTSSPSNCCFSVNKRSEPTQDYLDTQQGIAATKTFFPMQDRQLATGKQQLDR